MKNIFTALTILILILSIGQLNAQIDTINFTLSSEKVSTRGQDIFVSSTIEKTGNLLVWNQKAIDGINSNSFEINSSTIDWNQEQSEGTITCNMVIEGYSSEFVLIGQSNELSAVLTITISNSEQKKYLFNIDTITY